MMVRIGMNRRVNGKGWLEINGKANWLKCIDECER